MKEKWACLNADIRKPVERSRLKIQERGNNECNDDPEKVGRCNPKLKKKKHVGRNWLSSSITMN